VEIVARTPDLSRNAARGGPDGRPVVTVEVRDNGIGVPEAARERLFERYFRAHESLLPAVEGTGLGLSLVRETAEAFGGRVWAEHPGEGTVFAFTLPCRRSSDVAALSAAHPALRT
jgi:signal transduction histidine kinase